MNCKKIVIIRANTFGFEPRLIKEFDALSGFSRNLILWDRTQTGQKMPPSYIFKWRCNFGSSLFLLFFPIWIIFVNQSLRKVRPIIIHACDFSGMIPALIYAKKRKIPVIYDIWDSLTGYYPTKNKLLKKLMIKFEKYLISKANQVLIPDPERIRQMQINEPELLEKITVIYNSDIIPRHCRKINFKDKQIDIVYIGTLSQKIRGLEQLITTAKLNPKITFHIAGYGPDENFIIKLIRSARLSNLLFYGRMDRQRAKKLYQHADIIISLLDPGFENYQYATSTKVFEAMRWQKPVITTKNTATGKLIENARWGVAIAYNSQALNRVLRKIQEGSIQFELDPKKIQMYSWSKMTAKIRRIYNTALSNLK